MSWWLQVVLGMVSMFLRDGSYALYTVFVAKGRTWLAAAMDDLGDLAGIAVSVFTAGEVITHGINAHVAILIFALLVTSFFTTALFTFEGRKVGATDNGLAQLAERVKALEEASR